MENETGGPAFPGQYDHGHTMESWTGMTLRQYAAIKLKVPNSGTDWLDEMIKKSLHDDLAAKAMQGLLADSSLSAKAEEFAWRSYVIADVMMQARERRCSMSNKLTTP